MTKLNKISKLNKVNYTPEQLRKWAENLDGDNGDEWVRSHQLRAHADKIEECERYRKAIRWIEQALLPDPHDEREVSIDWLRKAIRVALKETK